ncbi:MAG: hypothetical protein MUE42_13745 [Opitutaceae bacterium]|nr:hypothetical protein [Opitutaceae bacterium]
MTAWSVLALCPLSAFAQTEEIRAGRAVVTLSLTLTESIGGYRITPAQEDADFNRGLTYTGILNPHDFDGDAAGFNYYTERNTEKERRLADGFFYPVERIVQTSRKALARRYLTADFIKDLVALGGVLAESPSDANAWRGYVLTAVTFKGYDEERRYVFAEKPGKAPVFLGWESQDGDAGALIAGHHINFSMAGGAESGLRTDGQKITYQTDVSDGNVSITENIFNPPAPTLSESESGKAKFTVRIFPGEVLPLRAMELTGRALYSSRYDARQAVYLNGKVTASGLAGTKFENAAPISMVEGTVTIGAEVMVKSTAAITASAYWAAVPESLRPALE